MKIGFIGQGFIGKNMADDFVERGFEVVRYALEEPYRHALPELQTCQVVFIAVPTPTTPTGFDDSIITAVLSHVPVSAIAVIKSTVLPGTAAKLQARFPDIVILHNPEFLREKHAAEDTRQPARNIIGMAGDTARHRTAAEAVMKLLPNAPYELVCASNESDIIKYAGNCFLALKVVFMNLVYDVSNELGADYETIRQAVGQDERIGDGHTKVVHESGHPGAVSGRGAGGHCFPKDLAAWRQMYAELLPHDADGQTLLKAIEDKNVKLLVNSGKDQDLLEEIYGPILPA